jgi:hypothetical protein
MAEPKTIILAAVMLPNLTVHRDMHGANLQLARDIDASCLTEPQSTEAPFEVWQLYKSGQTSEAHRYMLQMMGAA